MRSGRQERSDQNVNCFDEAHAELSQSCQNTVIVLPVSLGIKPPNSLTENEYGIIDRDSLPNLKQHRFLGSRRRLDGTGCSLVSGFLSAPATMNLSRFKRLPLYRAITTRSPGKCTPILK